MAIDKRPKLTAFKVKIVNDGLVAGQRQSAIYEAANATPSERRAYYFAGFQNATLLPTWDSEAPALKRYTAIDAARIVIQNSITRSSQGIGTPWFRGPISIVVMDSKGVRWVERGVCTN
jgi:hypothetical protein